MALKLDVPKGPKGVKVVGAYFQISFGGFEPIEGALYVHYVVEMYLSQEARRDGQEVHWLQRFTIPYPKEPQDLLQYLYGHTKTLLYQEPVFEIDFRKALDVEEIYPLKTEEVPEPETIEIKPPLAIRMERLFLEGLTQFGHLMDKETRWGLIELKTNIEQALIIGDFENVIEKIKAVPALPAEAQAVQQALINEVLQESTKLSEEPIDIPQSLTS